MAKNWSETETVIKRIVPYLQRRGYDLDKDLSFEEQTESNTRYKKGYVDISVKDKNGKVVFLIEAKRAAKTLNSHDKEQALEYGESQKVAFVVVTNGNDIQSFNVHNKKPIRWNGKLIEKIPTKTQLGKVLLTLKADKNECDIPLDDDNSLPFRPGLPLKQLNELFKRCHNNIRKIEKNEETAFADFSKLLFLKLFEEKADIEGTALPYSYVFFELAEKKSTESDQVKDAIMKMLETIKQSTKYSDVLVDSINLKNPKTFSYIVKQLASVCFHDSSVDSKGAAFDYYVRATLKGKKLGQYFTPRPLVEIMSCLIGEDKIINSLLAGENVKVLDPACGTGGFLVYLMQKALSILDEKMSDNKITSATYESIKKKVKEDTFYGSDAHDGISAAAKMNMIIAGDGHTNIKAEDSLSRKSMNWSNTSQSCDVIITNPPFGTSENESLTVNDLAEFGIRTTKGQHLFLQKMVNSVYPVGDICTVIDEGVLNTASACELRKWIMRKCEVVCVMRLPEETFKPNKINVRASVIYLKKRDEEDIDLEKDYSITFCDLQSLGYHGSGENIRGFDFNKLKDQISNIMMKSDGNPIRKGYNWEAYNVSAQEIISEHSFRLDYKYWYPNTLNIIEKLIELPTGKTIFELNNITTSRGKSPHATEYVDSQDGYALVIKAGSNISKFGELVEEGDYIEKNVYDEMSGYHLENGDILLASTGDGTLGKCCVYRSSIPAIADGHVTVIRVDDLEINPEYLCDYLRCGFGAEQINRLFTGSTGLIELTPESVDKIIVDLLDDVEAQKAIVHKLRQNEQEYREAIQKIETQLEDARDNFLGIVK